MFSKNVVAFMPKKKGNMYVAHTLPKLLTVSYVGTSSQGKLKMISLWCLHTIHTHSLHL